MRKPSLVLFIPLVIAGCVDSTAPDSSSEPNSCESIAYFLGPEGWQLAPPETAPQHAFGTGAPVGLDNDGPLGASIYLPFVDPAPQNPTNLSLNLILHARATIVDPVSEANGWSWISFVGLGIGAPAPSTMAAGTSALVSNVAEYGTNYDVDATTRVVLQHVRVGADGLAPQLAPAGNQPALEFHVCHNPNLESTP